MRTDAVVLVPYTEGVRRGMFERITAEGNKMGGVPCIRHLRIPITTVVSMVADGMSREEILETYPDLEAEDISQALRYATALSKDRDIELSRGA